MRKVGVSFVKFQNSKICMNGDSFDRIITIQRRRISSKRTFLSRSSRRVLWFIE